MLFYLAFKNVISRKSSVVIVLFISFAVMLVAVINSVFDCTENGIEKVFSGSFTGDIAIFPQSDSPLSLFGDETPMTGSLTKINTVVPFVEIVSALESCHEIEKFVPQIMGNAIMEFNGHRFPVCVFGVSAEKYIDCMSSIKIIDGSYFSNGERGVMLSKEHAMEMGAKIGDTIQFIVADGSTFRIRAASLSAIYEYPINNETLDRIVLADAFTVRSLMDMIDFSFDDLEIDSKKTDLLENDFDIESLFEDAEDIEAVFVEDHAFEKTKSLPEVIDSSASWNFIVGRLIPGENPKKIIRELNKLFKKNFWPVRAVDWRTAAGSTAIYLYWMRIIFNAGVIVILVAGFIIINNTLVVNVLNRTQEIGTLRATGASRGFVSIQCMLETFMLTVTAGFLGCVFATAVNTVITASRIEFANLFLRQLFGSDVLSVSTSFNVLLKSMLLSILLGLIGWIYPVRTAMGVSPVQAMREVVI